MDAIVIAAGSVMIAALFGVGSQIIHFHRQTARGPQCARCPLYQTACARLELREDSSDETEPLSLTPEMAI